MIEDKLDIITLNKPGITDFACARNELLRKVRSEWVLFLDSDEKLSSELEKEISRLNPEDNTGFYIKRKIIFLGKEIGEDKVLRLAKKNSGKWVRKVHETWQVKGKIGTLKNYIIHNTADNLHEDIEKMNRYSSIHAAENLKEGKRSNLFKMIFYPKLKFIQNILAGRGFVFSVLQSFHSFLGWAKQWELQKD
ncbi:MAG: hypothetical protein NTZ07_03080 [Candidatus Woesebacteria bacterium]|nr:hypothetical protein [Candidatus Woesebacteria bacterium]